MRRVQPILLTIWTGFFFFMAAPARRSIVQNLAIILPGSSWLMNHFRAFRTLRDFAWTIAETANYRVHKADFTYEIVGSEFLEALTATRGAIVLTAHMGSADLGAALFAQKCQREIRMVRAPEPDRRSEQHLQSTVRQAGEGAVKIADSSKGAMLSFDLLGALRAGEIVSIQGDRIITGVASVQGEMFGEPVLVPSGPFSLAQVAQVPIFPLFVVRVGFRRYQVVVCEPIRVARSGPERAADISAAVASWCAVLERVIAKHWRQWFGFGPFFARHVRS